MSRLKEVRKELTELLKGSLQIPGTPGLPSHLGAGVFYLRPTRGQPYVDLRADVATWSAPAVNLQAVVTIPSANLAGAQDWVDVRVERVWYALDVDPTLGGLVSSLVLAQVSEPGLVTVQEPLLAVELTFDPCVVAGFGDEFVPIDEDEGEGEGE